MNVEMVELLRPQHPGKGLPLYQTPVGIIVFLLDVLVKLGCFGASRIKEFIKVVKTIRSIG